MITFQLFFWFSLHRTIWKSHVTISVLGCAPHAGSRSLWYWRMWESVACEHV